MPGLNDLYTQGQALRRKYSGAATGAAALDRTGGGYGDTTPTPGLYSRIGDAERANTQDMTQAQTALNFRQSAWRHARNARMNNSFQDLVNNIRTNENSNLGWARLALDSQIRPAELYRKGQNDLLDYQSSNRANDIRWGLGDRRNDIGQQRADQAYELGQGRNDIGQQRVDAYGNNVGSLIQNRADQLDLARQNQAQQWNQFSVKNRLDNLYAKLEMAHNNRDKKAVAAVQAELDAFIGPPPAASGSLQRPTIATPPPASGSLQRPTSTRPPAGKMPFFDDAATSATIATPPASYGTPSGMPPSLQRPAPAPAGQPQSVAASTFPDYDWRTDPQVLTNEVNNYWAENPKTNTPQIRSAIDRMANGTSRVVNLGNGNIGISRARPTPEMNRIPAPGLRRLPVETNGLEGSRSLALREALPSDSRTTPGAGMSAETRYSGLQRESSVRMLMSQLGLDRQSAEEILAAYESKMGMGL